jgi:signal transduction histidine kinase
MKLHTFIQDNLDAIVGEWEAFAQTLLPAAKTMSKPALRNHSREILMAIVKDMQGSAIGVDHSIQSTPGHAASATSETMAAAHGAVRHAAGFDLGQLMGEFRALRASVFALWRRGASTAGKIPAISEIARFDDAIDQALSESVERYSSGVAASRDIFLGVLGHDLRSPLQSIHMASAVLVSPGLSEAVRHETAMRVRRASNSMEKLITDLLEFTRSRSGHAASLSHDRIDAIGFRLFTQ